MPSRSPEALRRQADQRALRKAVARERLDQIKVGQGCADCPDFIVWPACVLAFDHLPDVEKIKDVANMIGWSWEKIAAELAKCEVVCHNHHAIRTRNRRVNSSS